MHDDTQSFCQNNGSFGCNNNMTMMNADNGYLVNCVWLKKFVLYR